MGHIRFEFVEETNRETSKSGTATHRYLLQYENIGDYTPLAAELYILTHTLPIVGGFKPMVRKSLTWEPLTSHGPRYFLGFFVNVNYAVPERIEIPLGEDVDAAATPIKRLLSRRFYGEDETVKIDVAFETKEYFAQGVTSEETQRIKGYGNNINPTPEGPQGIEMPFSRFAWDEHWSFPRNELSDSYLFSIPDLRNHTNETTFRGFQRNTVKLVDFTVDDRVPQTWEEMEAATVDISFKFVVEPWAEINREGVEPFVKQGWVYVSPVMREIVSEDQKTSTFNIIAFRAQRVCEMTDFGALGIS